MIKYLKDLWKRKDLLLYLVTSGLKAQHRNSFLGYFWWLLDPLLNVVVYYFMVSVVLGRGGENYPVFLVIGLVVFRFFSTTLASSAKAITKNAGIISQIYLPKAIFGFGTTLTQSINFLFGLVVIAIFLVIFQTIPGWEVLWLPYVLLMQVLFQAALALLISYLCVFIRDIENLISHITRIMRYAAPVIWEADRLPAKYSWVVEYNPFAWILDGYRSILMYNRLPNLMALAYVGVSSLLFIFLMLFFYQRNEHRIIKAL
ncbi:ABC transporter permease [Spirochaeta isovalerica]|uniref:Transport permease protein n=1 Tax=Spirochaeta isovalerica TaxID=150 RepID=A0A841RBL8_9SPIO|nr:ABC transporter permease [Spirochaeta isovalerica]MBB6480751.1 lipopolysaccharide transport system permease protein/teichoic acid transport system permease protein [Spirochaeta isovalerica]